MRGTKAGEVQRKTILDLVAAFATPSSPSRFVPGETPVPYAGRVFGSEEIVEAVNACLDGWFTGGRYSQQFESALADRFGLRSAIFVNSGSSANLVAVSSLTSELLGDARCKPGDEVITVAASFPSTVGPIVQNRLKAVFVDVDLGTYNINVDGLKEAVSDKTRAIVLAHTLGNPFDLGVVERVAREHGLYLVEDCCDAFGSEYRGRAVGTFGSLATLSFYPAHHITTGEGGAVLTDDRSLERIARSIRDWGRDCYCETGSSDTCGARFTQKFGDLPWGYDHKYVYSHIGYNLKATDVQAAIGVAQLKKLPEFIERRRRNFAFLRKELERHEGAFILPEATPESNPAWFAFPLTVRPEAGFSRAEIVRYLEDRKIATRMLFGGNLLRQPAFRNIDCRRVGDLANTDRVVTNTFFVGTYPGLTEEMTQYIVDTIDLFLRSR